MSVIGTALTGILIENGLNILSQIIQIKGKEFIEERTRIKLDNPNLTIDQLMQLKTFELDNENEFNAIISENTKPTTQPVPEKSTELNEDKFVNRFPYFFAFFLVVCAFSYIIIISFTNIPKDNAHFVDVSLGFCLTAVLATIIQFFYGSSSGSKDKDKELMKTKGK